MDNQTEGLSQRGWAGCIQKNKFNETGINMNG